MRITVFAPLMILLPWSIFSFFFSDLVLSCPRAFAYGILSANLLLPVPFTWLVPFHFSGLFKYYIPRNLSLIIMLTVGLLTIATSPIPCVSTIIVSFIHIPTVHNYFVIYLLNYPPIDCMQKESRT